MLWVSTEPVPVGAANEAVPFHQAVVKRCLRMAPSDHDPGFGIFHPGELEAHERYGVASLTKGLAISVRKELTPQLVAFLQRQPFFFLATASADGDCDCS